jgi:hypothetical protein
MDVNGFDILTYRDLLVLADHDKKKTTAYAWADGRPVWSFDGPIATTFPMRHAADLDTPSTLFRPAPWAAVSTGDALYHLDPAGLLTEYAVATGRPTGRTWSGVPTGDGGVEYLAYEGTLYVAGGATLRTVRLDGGEPVQPYTARVSGDMVRLSALVPCGSGWLCFLDGAAERSEVVALDGERVVWRTPVADASTIHPLGGAVLVGSEPRDADGPRSALLGADGRQVLDDAQRKNAVLRVDGGNLILAAVTSTEQSTGATGSSILHVRLTGLDPATMRRTDLGEATLVAIGTSASGGYLVSTAGGLHIYRFTS